MIVVKAQRLIANLINKTPQKQKSTQSTTNSDTNRNTDQARPKVLHLPYVKHISELIQKAYKRMGVRVVFRLGHMEPYTQNSDASQEYQRQEQLQSMPGTMIIAWTRKQPEYWSKSHDIGRDVC